MPSHTKNSEQRKLKIQFDAIRGGMRTGGKKELLTSKEYSLIR